MRVGEALSLFVCWFCFIWAGWQIPITYINLKQNLFRDEYRLVAFEVDSLRAVKSDDYSATAVGSVEGKREEMGIGHFYIGGSILHADAEARFSPGSRIQVYYNPEISNFTFNSRTARFVPPARYARLTFAVQLRMLVSVYAPLVLSLILWAAVRRHNKLLHATCEDARA
jgi:hypothetical protein